MSLRSWQVSPSEVQHPIRNPFPKRQTGSDLHPLETDLLFPMQERLSARKPPAFPRLKAAQRRRAGRDELAGLLQGPHLVPELSGREVFDDRQYRWGQGDVPKKG